MDVDSVDENSDDFSEDEYFQMPSANVPRIHWLIHRKLETQHFMHGSSFLTEIKSPQIFKEMRENLMKYLSGLLGKDPIASQ